MGNRSVTVERFKEIERRLRDGRSLREIARAIPDHAETPTGRRNEATAGATPGAARPGYYFGRTRSAGRGYHPNG
jgi:hypothetical protein